MKPNNSRPKKRCRPLRIENDDTLWFVTSRTIEERFWLHPILTTGLEPPNRAARRTCSHLEKHCDKRLLRCVAQANAVRGPFQPELTLQDAKRIARGLVGAVVARAQDKYKVKVYALVVMSNHMHLVVQTTRKNLSDFMGYVKGRIADTVNRLTGKRGPLWARRYDAQAILDDNAACDRLAYSLDNPVKEGLVDSAEQWPGLNLAFGMDERDAFAFEYLDCTAWHRARRPVRLEPFYRKATLKLSPLPACSHLSREAYRRSVETWLCESNAGQEPRRSAMGVDKVVYIAFDARPRNPERRRRPYAFGSHDNRLINYEAVSQLYAVHHECSMRFLAGKRDVVFPSGTYPPPIRMAA